MTGTDSAFTPPEPRPGAAEVTFRRLPLADGETFGGWTSARAGNPNKQVLTWVSGTETLLPGARTGATSFQLGIADSACTPTTMDFAEYKPQPFSLTGFDSGVAGEGLVFVGKLFGQTSPVETARPMLGAQLRVEPGAEFVFVVDETFTHGVIALDKGLFLENESLDPATIAITQPGAKTLNVVNASDRAVSAILLGGR
ncbi:hypothetical protein QP994_06585 [Corynebacterium sp. MSK044]|uniref:hypothetical protein n=1 Tax=Corynebacterium sp. MSK044 TaxID=3050195 RepID=UPI00254D8D67|nr:hypothetical protein [Corynebacterium sp. MSK044]MDK8797550.1 hypothetical protein [Corynebacterium sp. MSK044]